MSSVNLPNPNPLAPPPATGPSPKTQPLFGKRHFGQEQPEDGYMAMRRENINQFSRNDRIKAAAKGAMREVLKPSALMKDFVISALITIATSWLPGSQLLTIPAYLAISASFRAVAGAEHGYKNPAGSHEPIRHGGIMMFPVTSD